MPGIYLASDQYHLILLARGASAATSNWGVERPEQSLIDCRQGHCYAQGQAAGMTPKLKNI